MEVSRFSGAFKENPPISLSLPYQGPEVTDDNQQTRLVKDGGLAILLWELRQGSLHGGGDSGTGL